MALGVCYLIAMAPLTHALSISLTIHTTTETLTSASAVLLTHVMIDLDVFILIHNMGIYKYSHYY